MSRRSKKLSLDGSVPGIQHNRRDAHSRSSLDGFPQIDLPHPQRQYEADPGRMDVIQPSYDGYEWKPWQRETPSLRLDPIAVPHEPVEHIPTYKESIELQRIISEHLERFYSSEQEDVTNAERVGPVAGLEQTIEEASAADPMSEMVSELERQVQQTQEQFAPPAPPPEQDLAQEFFDEQMQWFHQFGMMGPM